MTIDILLFSAGVLLGFGLCACAEFLAKSKSHHFRIKVRYHNRQGRTVGVIQTVTVALSELELIENHRELRKLVGPGFIALIPSIELCNGRITVEPTCYLGRW